MAHKKFELHSNQICDWRRQLLDNAANVLGGDNGHDAPVDLAPLHAGSQYLTCLSAPRGMPGYPRPLWKA